MGKRLITDKIPTSNNLGEFQINLDKFKEYLPKNYTPDFEKQVLAVYNFINKNKNLTYKQIYRKYNSGNPNRVLDGYKNKIFEDLYKRVRKIK